MAKNWRQILGDGRWVTGKYGGRFYIRDKKIDKPLSLKDAIFAELHKDTHRKINGVDVFDVKDEYMKHAHPGQGRVIIQSGASKHKHGTKQISDEYVQAEWLVKTFGGDVTLLRTNQNKRGIYRYPAGNYQPDLMWNNRRLEYWELKEPKNPLDGSSSYRHGFKQIGINKGMAAGNAGGLIIKISNPKADSGEIIESISNRFRQAALSSIDVIVKWADDDFQVFRLKR